METKQKSKLLEAARWRAQERPRAVHTKFTDVIGASLSQEWVEKDGLFNSVVRKCEKGIP